MYPQGLKAEQRSLCSTWITKLSFGFFFLYWAGWTKVPCCHLQIPSPPVGIMHWVSLNRVLSVKVSPCWLSSRRLWRLWVFIVSITSSTVRGEVIYRTITHYIKNVTWGLNMLAQKKKQKQSQIASVYHRQVSPRAPDGSTTSPFPSRFLTISCAVLFVVKPPGWLRLGLRNGKYVCRRRKGGTLPPLSFHRSFWGHWITI